MGFYFDMNKLAKGVESNFNWMLKGKHGDKIVADLNRYRDLTDKLRSFAHSEDVLKELIETKITNGFYRTLADQKKAEFDKDFADFFTKHKQGFNSQQAIVDLGAIIKKYSIFPFEESKAQEWARKLLSYPTLQKFTDELYSLRGKGENLFYISQKKGKSGKDKKYVLGDKGADHYLRNVGHWDIIPIDIHEKRFIIRTGIFHRFGVAPRQDPLGYRSLQNALSQFCSSCLNGMTICDFPLDSAPGVVDLFIWSYCADDRYAICGSIPKCAECKLSDACFFGICCSQVPSMAGSVAKSSNSVVGTQQSASPKSKPITPLNADDNSENSPSGDEIELQDRKGVQMGNLTDMAKDVVTKKYVSQPFTKSELYKDMSNGYQNINDDSVMPSDWSANTYSRCPKVNGAQKKDPFLFCINKGSPKRLWQYRLYDPNTDGVWQYSTTAKDMILVQNPPLIVSPTSPATSSP